ncbi:MAG: cyclic peptide export ABC transporter [Pyrinomonadaceae bacterium]
MKLISFLLRFSPGIVALAVFAGLVTGVSNSAILALINVVLSGPESGAAAILWSFVGLCALMLVSRIVSEVLLLRLSQDAIYNLRQELARRILAAPLRRLEEQGAHRLLMSLTSDVPGIAQALNTIAVLCIQVAIVVSILIYMAWLSPTLLLCVCGFMAVGIASYQLMTRSGMGELELVREHWDQLYKHFTALTEGIKELKLHGPRRRSFRTELLDPAAHTVRRHNVRGMSTLIIATCWGQLLFFVLIGALIFALPALQQVGRQELTGYTITILYMITPLQTILGLLPELGRANIAMQKVDKLGLSLSADAEPDPADDARPPTWRSLELIGVTHAYHRERENSSFTLGPIDLSFTPGELVFLIGGNGSGKTTLAKLLTGLYLPESGAIRLDGRDVDDENREAYRQLFSVVFSDFFLFESLLGLPAAQLDGHIQDLLVQLQLQHKVQIKEGELSTIDLSQGQRKRLALLTAYLEDRQIYLFDEWAADQDPLFKEIFYYRLLPELKRRGKTVVVISHDDRYYHVADRVIKLDYGKVETLQPVGDYQYT